MGKPQEPKERRVVLAMLGTNGGQPRALRPRTDVLAAALCRAIAKGASTKQVNGIAAALDRARGHARAK